MKREQGALTPYSLYRPVSKTVTNILIVYDFQHKPSKMPSKAYIRWLFFMILINHD